MTTAQPIPFKDTPEHYREARKLHEAGDIDRAEDGYLKALCLTPEDPYLLFLMGTLFMQRKAYGLAIPILTRAIEMHKKFAEAYNNLGLCLKNCGHRDMARQAFELALKCGDAADFHNNLATLAINEGIPEQAERHCLAALKLQPKHIQAQWNLGLAYLEQGRFDLGWPLYKWGYRANGRPLRQYDCAPWDGRSHVKKMAVFGEQGVGDEIMFGSTIVDAAKSCDQLIIDCHPRLVGLFQRSFPNARVYGTRKTQALWIWDEMPIDAKASLADIAAMVRPDAASFPGTPYMVTNPKADRKAANYLAALPGKGPRIGISWRGGTADTNINDRSVIPDKLVPLFKAAPVTWVSLQYDASAPDIVRYMKDRHGVVLHHAQAMIDDFDQLTSLAGQCDLVITVDQTLVWQMGAIGKECWVLVPHKVSWRYPPMFGDRTPWFNSLRLFRQAADCKWEPVLERVTQELTRFVSEHDNQRNLPAAE